MRWRAMACADLEMVAVVAERVHPAFPESPAVLAERYRLFPRGCRVLARGTRIGGYLLSHPWHAMRPPPLNSLLGEIPTAPTTYYIHDLALLPEARGGGSARIALDEVDACAVALGISQQSLVAVNRSVPFWRRFGFEVCDVAALTTKLESYGSDARFMVRQLPVAPPAS